MTGDLQLRTERLLLRRWRDGDRAPFAAMNADPTVMRHFPATLTREQSDAFVDRIVDHFDRHGWGLWAVDVVGAVEGAGGRLGFIGFVGLWPVGFDAHFTPAVEIGWRLVADAWGNGYATEAAAAAAADGFERLGLDEIVSFTSVTNAPSQRVMRRIGMSHDEAGDFDHPNVPEGSPLRRHVLYRLDRERWRATARSVPR